MATEESDLSGELREQRPDHSPVERLPSVLQPFLEHDRVRYYLQVLPAALMLGVFMFLPILGIIVLSFAEPSPIGIQLGFDLGSYVEFFSTYRFMRLIDTVLAGILQVFIAFVVGFPLAYYTGIRMRDSKYTLPLLLLFAIPFITNYILRTLSWIAFLGRQGVVNTILRALGISNEPVSWLLFSDFAVHVSLIASYIPYMLFPTWLAMSRIDNDVLRASSDLGASPLQTIRYIVLPLSLPGVVIGAVFVFVGVLGESVVPTLLGGPNVTYVTTTVDNAVSSLNLPLASAISTVLMLMAAIIVVAWERLFGLRSIGEI
jgi:ABC-type spermidine/putrescine transport system permease subunit I